MAIFDKRFQLLQPTKIEYTSPKGYIHTNQYHPCKFCNTITLQAVSRNTDTFTAGNTRLTTVGEYRDCLLCDNTTYEVFSKKHITHKQSCKS